MTCIPCLSNLPLSCAPLRLQIDADDEVLAHGEQTIEELTLVLKPLWFVCPMWANLQGYTNYLGMEKTW